MVSGMDLVETGINRLVRTLLADGVTVREINTMLLALALRRMIDEVGEEVLRNVLQCEINQIDEGAYREGYIAPEAPFLEHPARPILTVIEGGGDPKV